MKSDLEVGPAAALKSHLHINASFLNLFTLTVEPDYILRLLKWHFDSNTFHCCIACTEVKDLNMFSVAVLLLYYG